MMAVKQTATASKGITNIMYVRVGCEFRYEATWPTPTVMLVQPRRDGTFHMVHEEWQTTSNLPMQPYFDIYGNLCQRVVLPVGENVLRYDATVSAVDEVDEIGTNAEQMPVEALPSEVLLYTLPSRFCL
jgi:hypothetical protein